MSNFHTQGMQNKEILHFFHVLILTCFIKINQNDQIKKDQFALRIFFGEIYCLETITQQHTLAQFCVKISVWALHVCQPYCKNEKQIFVW